MEFVGNKLQMTNDSIIRPAKPSPLSTKVLKKGHDDRFAQTYTLMGTTVTRPNRGIFIRQGCKIVY
jgi:hypothetical protein